MPEPDWLFSDPRTWTEVEWLACTHPWPMMQLVKSQAKDRKLRLYAVASCRHIWHLLTDKRSQNAVMVAELYADNEVAAKELLVARNEAWHAVEEARPSLSSPPSTRSFAAIAAYDSAGDFAAKQVIPEHVAEKCGGDAAIAFSMEVVETGKNSELDKQVGWTIQCNLVREIFGNPFRPVTLDPSCLTPMVVSLARTIYDERAFDRTPDLAVALEEAGCDNADILNHCRGPGPHVRGCWVVDAILGKE